jgi:hypothetical protein
MIEATPTASNNAVTTNITKINKALLRSNEVSNSISCFMAIKVTDILYGYLTSNTLGHK